MDNQVELSQKDKAYINRWKKKFSVLSEKDLDTWAEQGITKSSNLLQFWSANFNSMIKLAKKRPPC